MKNSPGESSIAAPLRRLYARSRVYEGVMELDSFGPWLERLEKRITEKVLAELAEEIPPAWYEDEWPANPGQCMLEA